MSELNMSITFDSNIDRLVEQNQSFDKGRLRIAHTNGNRNGSYISKETFERCISSIYNCPVVCRYDRETDEFGAHDVELVTRSDGGMSLVNMTHPIGVVPSGAEYSWEEVEESDETIHEYLCVDVLLWKRQEAYQRLKEEGVVAESMEISVYEGGVRDGVFVIDRFEFTAFCLLGTEKPCFPSASLTVFSSKGFQAQFDEMMSDFKESFALLQSSQAVSKYSQEQTKKEEGLLDEKKTLMAQYGLTVDDLDFALEDFSIDELKEKFDAVAKNQKQSAFALASDFKEELIAALSSERFETIWGIENKYCYVDHDVGASEVYVWDRSDSWRLYGFTYSINGDVVSVNFASKKRKKFSIVDFDGGEQSGGLASVFGEVEAKFTESEKLWSEKYQTAVDKVSAMESELSELKRFKEDVEAFGAKQAREEVLSQFEDLSGVEAFETLKEECEQYSSEVLEEKCFAIRGRVQVAKFSIQEPKPAPRLKVGEPDIPNEPYGGVFSEYGIAGKR